MARIKPVIAACLLVLSLGAAAHAEAVENPLTDGESWSDLSYTILGGAEPTIGDDVVTLDAPYRANDAATVPITIRQTDTKVDIDSLILVVDENPAPVVAEIEFADAMLPLDFETRVRVNQYSNVRAIANTSDGERFMTGRFVKASGGCSAPATKDPELALASMGQIRMKYFGEAPQQSVARREAQIMIRHPNYSGLQRDQITQLFINAHFVDVLEVTQGDDLLFRLTGGISISENPIFRFSYDDNGSETIRIRAEDTQGNVFEQEIPKAAAT